MKKTATIRKSILSLAAALVLVLSLTPATVFADAPSAAAQPSVAVFADSIERVIRAESFKVYAATARAGGNEAEARALEAAAVAPTNTSPIAVETVEASVSAVDVAPAAASVDDEPTFVEPSAPALVEPAENAPVESAEAAPATAPAPATIQIGASAIPFVQCYLASVAPDHAAGLWWGDSSTTDGGLGYFVGHNPGVFAPVVALSVGDAVAVTDDAGAARTYVVIDVFDVPNTATLEQIQPRICGHGESIALQACVQGGAFYRVVVAA